MTSAHRGLREWSLLGTGLLATAAMLLLPWLVMGPANPVLALVITAGVFGVSPLLHPVGDLLPLRRLSAGAGELRLLERCGVRSLAALLERSGWNRGVGRARAGRTRGQLLELAGQARRAQAAHAIAAVAHLLGAGLLTADGGAAQAVVLLLLGLIVHALPGALQRWVLGRLARIGLADGRSR